MYKRYFFFSVQNRTALVKGVETMWYNKTYPIGKVRSAGYDFKKEVPVIYGYIESPKRISDEWIHQEVKKLSISPMRYPIKLI